MTRSWQLIFRWTDVDFGSHTRTRGNAEILRSRSMNTLCDSRGSSPPAGHGVRGVHRVRDLIQRSRPRIM